MMLHCIIPIETGLSEYYPEYMLRIPLEWQHQIEKGFDFALERIDKEHGYEFVIKYGMLSDIVGQGVEDLKKYNSIKTHLKMNFANLFALSNDLIMKWVIIIIRLQEFLVLLIFLLWI